jgi:hypothetical protein
MKLLRIGAAALALALAMGVGLAQKADNKDKPAKNYPTQASVAAKKKFDLIANVTEEVKNALEAEDIAGAKKLVDKQAAFKGTVVKVYKSPNNSVLILNFTDNYRKALTAVLRPDYYSKFPDMDTLLDKQVLVSGKITLYQDRPQIMLISPSQIKIITSRTKD